MISVCFQSNTVNIMVIQVYAPTTNTEEAKVEWFYEDLQDHLELCYRLPLSKHNRRLLLDYDWRCVYPQTHGTRSDEVDLERKIRVIIILRFREIQHL